MGALLWLRSALRCCGELLGAAGYSVERLRFGDFLEVIVLVEVDLLQVIVLHPRALGVDVALEDPPP